MLPAIICDNAKEMILGEFNNELNETSCHLRQTKPVTPWLNAAEREIKELKKGYERKMIKSRGPKRLWEHYLELESYIRSCIWHIQTGCGGPRDNYVWRSILHKPVL